MPSGHRGGQVSKISHSLAQAIFQGDARLPSQNGARFGNVRPALFRVVFGERLEDDFGTGSGDGPNVLCKLQDGHFMGVAKVYRVALLALHETVEPVDEV